MGNLSASIYILILEEGTEMAIEDDLQSELEVETANRPPVEDIPRSSEFGQPLESAGTNPIQIFRIRDWSPDLVSFLDTHVVRLERTGAQFVFLTSWAIAEQLLTEAPNFRNRITEVLRIAPEDFSRGASN